MKSKVISILIADDNREFTAVLTAFLRRDPAFKVVAICHDGEEALKQVRLNKPDVVILDIIMPYLDGIEVLGRIKNMMAGYNPKIIVFSAVGQDSYTAKALDLGANFYFVKPFDMTLLSSRIKELYSRKQFEPKKKSEHSAEVVEKDASQLDEVLYNLGVPKRLKGYVYIKDAAKMIIENSNMKRRYTTDIYPTIAENHDTKAENVERAIRNVIDVAYKSNFRDAVKYFDFTKEGDLIKPSNSKFIELIISTVMEKGSSEDGSEE